MQRSHILNRITMKDVLHKYTSLKITNGRTDCPIHGGDKCFAVYDNSFYCFSCGAGGDLIKFVSLLNNIGYRDAMLKIDVDFGLGVFKRKLTLKERHMMRAESEKNNAILEEKQIVRECNLNAYNALCEYHKELKDIYPSSEVIRQAYVTSKLLDMLFEDEEFYFDCEKFIDAMRLKRGDEIEW